MLAELALIGFGHVGRRFAQLLEERRDLLARDFDLECRIVAIATRRHGGAFRSQGIDGPRAVACVEAGAPLANVHDRGDGPPPSDGFEAIRRLAASDAPLRIAIETTTLDIRAGQPAIDHVRAALAAGCHAVTANKGPAAFAYEELRGVADAAGLAFLFEGAVMDGVPIFNLVRETMPAVSVQGFRGVVNSTTNHILTALEDGEAFGPALARMQAEGIAEADASLDVDGWDAAAKAAALANVFLGAHVTPHDVRREGIGPETGSRAVAARSRGSRLRLVAAGRRGQPPVVDLCELPPDDLLAGLRGTANALVIETDLLGRVAVTQLEGSLTQTAYALLSDVITIRRRRPGPHVAPARRSP